MKLTRDETDLVGQWLVDEWGTVRRDEVADRTEFLTGSVLEHVACSRESGGWETLLRDPEDGRFWERTYPQSRRLPQRLLNERGPMFWLRKTRRLFRVRIAGSGCRVQIEDDEGTSEEQVLGFLTTLDILAGSPEQAGTLAVESVRVELVELVLNRSNEPYRVELKEIREISGPIEARGGFTWFPDHM